MHGRIVLVVGISMLALAGITPARGGEAPPWRVLTDRSQLVVHVQPAGLLSPALHAHHFEPQEWDATLHFDPESVQQATLQIVVDVDSLQNHQAALSEEDHERVARQVRSAEVLDVANHPEVRVEGRRVRVDRRLADGQGVEGTMEGAITIRGVTRPIEIPFTARWSEHHVRASGTVIVRQSDFGIEPYSRFLGTVAVADEVEVEFAIDAEPDE